MATPRISVRISAPRLILAAGFSAAAIAVPTVAAFAMTGSATPTVTACPGGESEDIYTSNCTPDLVPNSPEPIQGDSSIAGNPSLPAVDGIPCTGANSGQCIGLGEEQAAEGPMAVPHSSVSSSP
jgi:hypothetical protein